MPGGANAPPGRFDAVPLFDDPDLIGLQHIGVLLRPFVDAVLQLVDCICGAQSLREHLLHHGAQALVLPADGIGVLIVIQALILHPGSNIFADLIVQGGRIEIHRGHPRVRQLIHAAEVFLLGQEQQEVRCLILVLGALGHHKYLLAHAHGLGQLTITVYRRLHKADNILAHLLRNAGGVGAALEGHGAVRGLQQLLALIQIQGLNILVEVPALNKLLDQIDPLRAFLIRIGFLQAEGLDGLVGVVIILGAEINSQPAGQIAVLQSAANGGSRPP